MRAQVSKVWRLVSRPRADALPGVQCEGIQVKPDHYTLMVLEVLGTHPKGLPRKRVMAVLSLSRDLVTKRIADLMASREVLTVGKSGQARYCLAANKALAQADVAAMAAATEARRKVDAIAKQRRRRAKKRALQVVADVHVIADWHVVQRVVPAAGARRLVVGVNSVWAWAATERRA